MIHWLIPTPRPTLVIFTELGVVRLPERLRDEAQRLGRADLQLEQLVRLKDTKSQQLTGKLADYAQTGGMPVRGAMQ